MKRYFLILILLGVLHCSAVAQLSEVQQLESLKKRAQNLEGKEKADCLNLLARTISTYQNSQWQQKSDSVYYYAAIAYETSKKLDYKKGTAAALVNLANAEWLKGIGLRINKKDDAETLAKMENYLSRTIPLANQAGDHETLGYAYENWSDMIYIKSKYKDSDTRAEYFIKAIEHFHMAGNDHKEGEDCTYQGERDMERGYYERAIEYLERGLMLNKKSLLKAYTNEEKEYHNYLYQQSLADIANLYKTAGDYETSLNYLNQGYQFALANNTGWNMEIERADVFRLLGQYDSSFYYYKRLSAEDRESKWIKLQIGSVFLMTKEYDRALTVFQQVLHEFKKVDVNGRVLMPALLGTANAYAGKNNYATAMPYLREGIGIALNLGIRPDVMNGYELLSRIHYHLGNSDSAYQYLLKYNILKDSIQNRRFLWRLNNYKRAADDEKKQASLLLLDKDNKLKTAQLKQEARKKEFLLILLSALTLAGIFVFRTITLKRRTDKLQRQQLENKLQVQQLENEKKQAAFQQQAAELEMQALRAQMNPHFIFNCLSAINRIILKNESNTASDYLTRFSRLIRMVLINSQKSAITLEDELYTLRLYLDMERLRFKNSFDYTISFKNEIDTGAIEVPPLLLQPFCENAIWHGLMHKEAQGHLHIEFSMLQNMLQCVITDDGIGRERSGALKSKSAEKEKSLGLQITTQRLALFNQHKKVQTSYTIEDIKDEHGTIAGTRVIIKILYKEMTEEIV